MRAAALVLCCVLVASGCASRDAADLVFLTREGCVLTDQMRANLDTALTPMGNARLAYRVVDLASLPADRLPHADHPARGARSVWNADSGTAVPRPDVTELPGPSSVR